MSPRLICAYARKYEPDWMVEDLRENMGWVDGFVELDQRDRVTELWSRREERVAELRRLAVETGADWCLIMDPDERMEDGAESSVRRAIEGPPEIRYKFPFMELWTPDMYRVDGVWGRKTRRRLFHLHAPAGERVLLEDARIYHLKMIEPENRTLRRRVHKQANDWDNRRLGFDYLDDDRGLELRAIEPGRAFSPPYRRYEFSVPEELLEDSDG